MTDLDPADRRPSMLPLPPTLAEIEEQLARMEADAVAKIRAELAEAELAYQALPWWQKTRVRILELAWRLDGLRWRILYRLHTGHPIPRPDNTEGTT